MVNPAFIVVPILGSLLLASVLFYFTCYNRAKSSRASAADWRPYGVSQHSSIRDWWPRPSSKKTPAKHQNTRQLDDEEFQMLNRTTLSSAHTRQDSYASNNTGPSHYHSNDERGISASSADDTDSDGGDERADPHTLAASISEVRLTLDAATSALHTIESTPSPVLRTEPELEQINRLQTLTEWHSKMLERVWQHSGPTPAPVDTRYLSVFKSLVKSIVDSTRSREVMRTQDLKRYGDLKRTEEFARESLRGIIRKRQRSGSTGEDVGDEEEAEVRELGVRAMRERIALAVKLGLPVPEDKDESEWGLSPSTPMSATDDELRTPPRAYGDLAVRDRLLGGDDR